MEEDILQSSLHDSIAFDYDTYEDYLDDQMEAADLFYLQDLDLAREMVEHGFRGKGDTMKREEFEARKKAAENLRQAKIRQAPQVLAHEGKDLANFPLLQALAEREKAVREGRLAVIIFIRDRNQKGQEISGYIDFAHRLKTEDFGMYFSRKAKLLPRPTDLSTYNWETQIPRSNSSPNWEVIADNETGLLFKNKRDRKVINVDPRAVPGDKSRRVDIATHEYIQVVLFDHETRRKT